MSEKLTPWFSPEIKPVHIGPYEAKGYFGKWYFGWNGQQWIGAGETPYEAMLAWPVIIRQDVDWRGLTRKPK